MEKASIEKILDQINQHSLEEQEMIVEIAEKRLIEEKRERIYQDYKKALKDYQSGRVKSGSVHDLLK